MLLAQPIFHSLDQLYATPPSLTIKGRDLEHIPHGLSHSVFAFVEESLVIALDTYA